MEYKMSNTGFYGIDDGHSNLKAINGKEFNVMSKVVSGAVKSFNVVSGEDDNYVYSVNGQSYTISNNIDKSLDTRFEDYPLSNINIILVNHVLDQMEAKGDISICTGLPFNRFYKNAERNHKLIEQKKAAFQTTVLGLKNKFNIKEHYICSEAVAAYFDIMLNDDGTENKHIKEMVKNESVVIVDIGGRTTDIVTFKADSIQFESSVTLDTGCLIVEDILYKKVSDKLEAYNVPKKFVSEIIKSNGIYKATKQTLDFKQQLEESKKQLAEEIINKLKQMMSNTLDIAVIAYVGGGSILLKKELDALYPSEYVKFAENPIFSNARGMKKLVKRSSVNV